jgi:hypothetical protein
MGKRYFGGWWPENLPVLPASSATSIPGVWHIDDVRMLLEDDYIISEIDPTLYIYKRGRGGSYAGMSWPRATFTVDDIDDVTLGCKSSVDFLAAATKNYSADFGHEFKFYWEKKAPGSSTWAPYSSPLDLITNKIKLGQDVFTTGVNIFRGYMANFRYSSAARYMTGSNDTTLTVVADPVFDGNTLALLKFNTSSTTPSVPWTSLDPAPTRVVQNFSMATDGGLTGQEYTAQTFGGLYTLSHDTGFTRNDGDFCVELYFRTTDNLNWAYSNDQYATLVDMRAGNTTTGPINVNAIAITLSKLNKVQVRRGDAVIIESDTSVASNTPVAENSWYHVILNSKDGVLRLYLRPISNPNRVATLVGEPYAGEHIKRLRLTNLTSADDDTQFRARVTYGALREAYSAPATLSANAPDITWNDPDNGPAPYFTVEGNYFPHLLGPNALPNPGSFTISSGVDPGPGFSNNQLDFRWEFATERLDGTAIEFDDAATILAWNTFAGETDTSFSYNLVWAGSGNYFALRAVAICGQVATVYSPVAFIERAET